MADYIRPGIQLDRATFDPERISAVTHQLMEHPLLQLPSLVELAKRLAQKGAVRQHNDQAAPTTDFTFAPKTHAAKQSPEQSISGIADANVWMSLLNVQQDPQYRALVDEVLDSVRPIVDARDPGMCNRGGWIFVTSPGAITPYHLDHENNFILQIRGKKSLYVFDPQDRTIVSDQALEVFHGKVSRELVVYRDELMAKARVFEAEPGMGAYMPSTAPHWVKNGDNVSITVSFTYYTDRTLRSKTLYRGNYLLRRMGLSPSPVGESPLKDSVKLAAFNARQLAAGLAGRTHPTLNTDRYAIHFS